ncbi:unnamed protein product, partial [Nezara viridula]
VEEEYSWGVCCEEAQSERCHQACKSAKSASELQHHCRRSDELVLYGCIQKQEAGEECCGYARSPECHSMCRRWLQQTGRMSWSRVTAACTNPVLQCLNNISKPFLLSSPQKYIHCCEFASTGNCKEVCKKTLKKRASDVEIMNNLKSACGPILLHGGEMKMTQCLLHTEAEGYTKRENNESGERSTKEIAMLHCCNKASSNQCRKLCHKTFHHSFDTWPEFNSQCLINSTEDNLSHENCTNLLEECADFEKMKDTSVEEICNSLSIKTANTNCISIEAFDNLNPPMTYSETLTRPCKLSLCSENQICRINRSCNSPRDDCDVFTCTPGCFLGQSHGLLAPVKSYVRVPTPDKKCSSSICQCTPQGSIKHCKEDCNTHEGSNCDDNDVLWWLKSKLESAVHLILVLKETSASRLKCACRRGLPVLRRFTNVRNMRVSIPRCLAITCLRNQCAILKAILMKTPVIWCRRRKHWPTLDAAW